MDRGSVYEADALHSASRQTLGRGTGCVNEPVDSVSCVFLCDAKHPKSGVTSHI